MTDTTPPMAVENWDCAKKQKEALDRNTKRQEGLKAQIALVTLELSKKVPGTIRLNKAILKTLTQDLRDVKMSRGCLYNGGVW